MSYKIAYLTMKIGHSVSVAEYVSGVEANYRADQRNFDLSKEGGFKIEAFTLSPLQECSTVLHYEPITHHI